MGKLTGIPEKNGYILLEVLISMLVFSYTVMLIVPTLFQLSKISARWQNRLLALDSAVSQVEAFRAGLPIVPSSNLTLVTRPDGVQCLTIQIDGHHALTYYTYAP